MTIEPSLASVPTVLAAALATVLGDARAQERVEKPPIKAERAEPRRTPESGESHLLFFERVLLVAGKDKLGRTEFEIGKEERRRSRKQPDEVRVQITFLSDRRSIPKPISLELLEGVVENAERTGDSPWSLSELKLARSGGNWVVRKLTFMRHDPPEDMPAESGHEILKGLRQAMDSVETRGVTYELQSISVGRRKSRGERELVLEFDVVGERFRSGYVRLLHVFVEMCDAPEGPFQGLGDARGERLLPGTDVVGASYELRLRLRPPDREEVDK